MSTVPKSMSKHVTKKQWNLNYSEINVKNKMTTNDFALPIGNSLFNNQIKTTTISTIPKLVFKHIKKTKWNFNNSEFMVQRRYENQWNFNSSEIKVQKTTKTT